MARVKFDRDGEGGREALGMGNCCVNVWDGSELELAWSKKGSSYFGNNFPIFLLSGISNTSILAARYFTLSKFLSNKDLLQYFP